MNHELGTKTSRRKEILDAALACFTEFDYANTTIEMIRERSGASVGSMYHHFKNKEDIAGALYILGIRDHNQRLIEALQQAESAEVGVKSVVRCFVDWIATHSAWARFIFYARSQAVKGAAIEQLKASNRQFYADIKAWFQPHISAGTITCLPPELYSSIIIGPAQDYARNWLSGKAKTPITELSDFLAEAAWKAIKQ